MEEIIRNFTEQLSYSPVIENAFGFHPADTFVVCGMGGSHLAAGLLKLYDPSINLSIHYDYGLPSYPVAKLRGALLIASSYSGNTVETINFAQTAFKKKLNLLVIASGGTLLDFAQQNNIPYIALPVANIQPRDAVGYSLLALSKATSNEMLINTMLGLKANLDPMSFKEEGQALAEKLKGKIPVIYSSNTNHSIAYNWKIKFNETTKIPAFFNMFPELNHNEISGFDVRENTQDLSRLFHFIFLRDVGDNPAINERMDVTKSLYSERKFEVDEVALKGKTVLEKAFNSIFLADWTSLHLALLYHNDPETSPLIDEFKTLLRP